MGEGGAERIRPPPTSYPHLLCGSSEKDTLVKGEAEAVQVPAGSNQPSFSRVRNVSKDPSVSSQAISSPSFFFSYVRSMYTHGKYGPNTPITDVLKEL